ncbi:hypothetical protein LCGC14_1861090 [marine sediment metagenome]|uniref:Uncharacterized protein n=1 Tax=marine sediment metagenome TaxID=412755 RepID=A0A0F9G7J5_9ZZZZ
MNETGSTTKDLQVAEELGILGKLVTVTRDKTKDLEERLKSVMRSSIVDSESVEEQQQLCPLAGQIRDIREGVDSVNHVITQILEELEL